MARPHSQYHFRPIFMAKIHVVNSQYDATVKACKVPNEYDADLVVHVVKDQYDAREDQLWFYVDSAYDASSKLFWVNSAYDADLKVCFTDDRYRAGWKKGHAFQNRL